MLYNSATPIMNTRQLRIIIIALVSGATLLCLVALLVSVNEVVLEPASQDTNTVLRLIHVGLFLATIVMGRMVGERTLRAKTPSVQGQTFVQRYTAYLITRLALAEGSTLFGAVIILIAGQQGLLRIDPTYYFHFLPYAYFLFLAKDLYPTEEKLSEMERMYGGM